LSISGVGIQWPAFKEGMMSPLVENPKNLSLPPGAVDILKAMFADYGRVVIKEEFGGGLSSGRVFLVRPIRVEAEEDRPDLPVVVKLASVSLIQREWQAYQSHIRHRLLGIAEIRGEPVLPRGSAWGGLCYPLLGGGTFDVVSLHNYCRQASLEDVRFVLGRLLKIIEQMIRLSHPSPEFQLRLSYDAVLPVNLLVAPQPPPPGVTPHVIKPHALPVAPLEPGDYVRLEGLAITKVDLQRRTVTLNLPPPTNGPPASFFLRLQLTETGATGQVNEILAPVEGVILKTRHSQLQEEAQAALGWDLDLTAETIPLAVGSQLPNPLARLPAILSETRDVRVGRIHGDMNLENILVDPTVRDVNLIDFAEARRDHVLHDFLRLETEVLTNLVPELLARHNLPPGPTMASFYQELHRATFYRGRLMPLPPHAVLEKPLAILETIRQTARRYLFDFYDPSEYYQGLVLYLLGALKFKNLSEATEAPLPKQVAFWGAAALLKLLETLPNEPFEVEPSLAGWPIARRAEATFNRLRRRAIYPAGGLLLVVTAALVAIGLLGQARTAGNRPGAGATSAYLTPTPSLPSLAPRLTATLQACPTSPAAEFQALWNSHRPELGCPTGPRYTLSFVVEEAFEGGHLFWRDDTDDNYLVYDRLKDGTELFEGDWTMPPWKWDGVATCEVGQSPPPGLHTPERGFGWLWCAHLGGPHTRLGWALDREYGRENLAIVQPFEHGLMFRASDPKVYAWLDGGRFFAITPTTTLTPFTSAPSPTYTQGPPTSTPLPIPTPTPTKQSGDEVSVSLIKFVARQGDKLVDSNGIGQQLVNEINRRFSLGRQNDHAHRSIAPLLLQTPAILFGDLDTAVFDLGLKFDGIHHCFSFSSRVHANYTTGIGG
jgi:hypothetical protein